MSKYFAWGVQIRTCMESQKRINPLITDIHKAIWISIIQLCLPIIMDIWWIFNINDKYGYPYIRNYIRVH